MRSLLASLCFALLAFPASASAYTLGYEAPGESIARGDALTFAVRTTAPEGSVNVRVSGTNTVGSDGLLTGPDGSWLDSSTTQALDDLQLWNVPSDSLLRQRPGRYYWQAYVKGEAADAPVGPVQRLDVTLPTADTGRGKLYPKFGKRGSWTFALSSANLPDSVSAGG